MVGERARATVRSVVFGVVEWRGRVLLEGHRDGDSGAAFLRPPGAAIAVGERAVETLRRVFRDELGAHIVPCGLLGILEARSETATTRGHELAFLYRVRLAGDTEDPAGAGADGRRALRWEPLAHGRPSAPILPAGLTDLL